MARVEGVDYSTSRPSMSSLKKAGKEFVIRYIGSEDYTKTRSKKWLTKSEAQAIQKAGLDLVIVFEKTAGRANGGRSVGLTDAEITKKELEFCGLPADTVVYYAVDMDDRVGPLIRAYYKALAEKRGLKLIGSYAGYYVIKELFDEGLITWGWQTYAWSDKKWDNRNHIEQYQNGVKVGGADVDLNRLVRKPFGQVGMVAEPTKPDTGGGDDQNEEEIVTAGHLDAAPGSQVTLTFVHGSVSIVGLAYYNTLKNDKADIRPAPSATVQVDFHYKNSGKGGQETYVATVGGDPADVNVMPPKWWQEFEHWDDGDYLVITNVSGSARPIGWDVSLQDKYQK